MHVQIRQIADRIAARLRSGENPGRAYCRGIRDILGDERIRSDGSRVSPSSRWLTVDSEMAWAARLADGDNDRYLMALSALEGLDRAAGATGVIVRTGCKVSGYLSAYGTLSGDGPHTMISFTGGHVVGTVPRPLYMPGDDEHLRRLRASSRRFRIAAGRYLQSQIAA